MGVTCLASIRNFYVWDPLETLEIPAIVRELTPIKQN
jgi:hypothetical protein